MCLYIITLFLLFLRCRRPPGSTRTAPPFPYPTLFRSIGANGAGKSTFLNAISGDQQIDGGQIVIDNRDVTRQSVWLRANHVARVFQDPLAEIGRAHV